VIKVEVLLAVVAIAAVSFVLFARAYLNWRVGTRMRNHAESVRRAAAQDMKRLQAEIDASRRKPDQDVSDRPKE